MRFALDRNGIEEIDMDVPRKAPRHISECIREYLQDTECHRRLDMLDAAAAKAESLLEELFWHYIRKTERHKWKSVASQVPCGAYRLDSLLVGPDGRRVCIELDGKEFHQDGFKDGQRDEAILASGEVDEVIHVPFPAIYYYARGCFAALATWHPWLEIRKEISTLSEDEAREELQRLNEARQGEGNYDLEYWLEHDAEVWCVRSEYLAFVMSFKAWQHRHNIQPIRRIVKSHNTA